MNVSAVKSDAMARLHVNVVAVSILNVFTWRTISRIVPGNKSKVF
jgi:hypothetical protein